MKTADIEYITTGLFTRFIPLTKAGEDAWRVMHEANGDAVLSIHAENAIGQLRRAGYKVAKAKKPAKVTAEEVDELLAELGV
jgi:hypothetical protein